MAQRLDYKKELESAARTMILVHEPDTLIKLIVRMIVRKVKVHHAGILLHDIEKNTYVLTVSGGSAGFKIPKGFARMDADNPLIRFLKGCRDKPILTNGALVYETAKKSLETGAEEERRALQDALYQLDIFDALVCIPAYFREDLLGILLLGNKIDASKFAQDELNFFIALASDVAMAIRNAQLFQEVELELDKRKRLFIHTTIALAAAIDAKDHYTHGHTARVTALSLDIARAMMQKNTAGFNEKLLEDLHIASLLHDIGKIGIPESILNKEGPLSAEEKKKMQEHPVVGAMILQPIKELDAAILGVKYHHERYDGSGYPEGLKAGQIPLIASVIAVADTFDAMTTDRPYRKALSKEDTLNEIQRQEGRQFDPEIADALIGLLREKPIPS
jgi:HD-GYP domain-containing protein (c-di-GMP phosphodiesterase class II)